ncbi:MAG TPA: DUF1254 domain-containing protein [Polyangiaceae bacterium]|nr:DUF1254 domain-containing protein [Polyangiaceae bacterium]
MAARSVSATLIFLCWATTAAAQVPPPDAMARRPVERRAVEALIWGVPAVNFELMVDALTKVGGDWNQVVYWSRLPDWKNQTLTPNPDVIYLMPFFDTRKGPVVLEIPPASGGSITGSIDEGWQTAVEDVGPAGVDAGKGGKYLSQDLARGCHDHTLWNRRHLRRRAR